LKPPNQTLQPSPVGAGSSAFAGYVLGPAWLSLGLPLIDSNDNDGPALQK
jgi:hypothetical protein